MNSNRLKSKEFFAGICFILPSLIGFIVFIFIPVIISFILSFTQWNFVQGLNAIKFNGISNYKKLFEDEWFIISFKNNILFTFITVPILIALGLTMAAIITRYIYGSGIVRTLVFIPYIASIVAVCTVWMVILQPSYGPVNQLLISLGIKNPPKWLADFKWALPSIMIVYIWQQLGYFIIVFIAGLKSIPENLYESAQIDGASSVHQFIYITIPMSSPTTFFLFTMGIIGSFKVFDYISVLTGGGPGNSSSVMAYYIYKASFEQFKTGYANTLSWALFILIFLVTFVQWNIQKKFANE